MTLAEKIASRPLRLRRLLALLATLALVAMIWNLLLLPIAWVAASQERWRLEVSTHLARDKGHAALEADIRAQLAALPAASAWNHFYKIAPGEDAQARLQRDVTSLCAAAGAVVQAVVPLPAADEHGLVRTGIRITTTVTADQLKALVGLIRDHPQYLRVEQLSVSAPQIQTAQQNPSLLVTLEVFGYSYPAGRGRT
jgi:Tfp pilus assembly protein PilO